MSSLVLELQGDAMNENVPVSNLLRKAFVIATKLSLEEFRIWVEAELEGYRGKTDIPPYRKISGEIRVHNPYNGRKGLASALSSCHEFRRQHNWN